MLPTNILDPLQNAGNPINLAPPPGMIPGMPMPVLPGIVQPIPANPAVGLPKLGNQEVSLPENLVKREDN